jgi:tRNA(Ile)-lysidine synthase
MRRRGVRLDGFEETVRATVARHRMFDEPPRAVVAVSGGPDSMALLHALVRLGVETIVAHFDHQLRGAASDEDAAFVAEAARRLGRPSSIEADDVRAAAAREGRNLEAVARDLRYAFLERAALAHGVAWVATGHTASDQAETVLLRLARGAGTDGLAGIAAVRPLGLRGVALARPLLDATRDRTLAYCREREIAFRVDGTNADLALARIRARETLLPELERLSPGASTNLARAAALAADDREYFAARVAELFAAWGVAPAGPVRLPAADVAALPAALRRRALREAVRRARGDLNRLTFEHVEALERLAGPHGAGRQAVLPYGLRARRDGPSIVFDVE